jgi:hypothetical protein
MTDNLVIAEECIDRQARTDVFEGRNIEWATGRVLLHALNNDGHSLCGRPSNVLTPTERRWSASYLPHLPRCQGCMTAWPGAAAAGHVNDVDDQHPAPAAGIDMRTAHGSAAEQEGATALRAVLDTYDLRRWMLTDLVIIDDTIVGGFSHPLTISPPRLIRRPALALTTFLHEQLHWMDVPGTDSATDEASKRWPDPPPPPAGCLSAESTWLHMSVCALEYQSLAEIIGAPAAAEELAQHTVYSWLYGQILANPVWFSDYLGRHGLRPPEDPPVPRRYFGDAWWIT